MSVIAGYCQNILDFINPGATFLTTGRMMWVQFNTFEWGAIRCIKLIQWYIKGHIDYIYRLWINHFPMFDGSKIIGFFFVRVGILTISSSF